MANFATHTQVAAVIGGSLATALVVTEQLAFESSFWLAVLFTAGTWLPDVDVSNGKPVRLLFTLFGLLAAFLVFQLVYNLPPPADWWPAAVPVWQHWPSIIAALAAWLFIRYPMAYIFQRHTRHRGLCHSLLMGAFWSLSWVYLALNLLYVYDFLAWLQGLAIFLGFVVHLLLDEFYSIDFEGARIKRSFGTALKLYQRDCLLGSLVILLAVAGLVWLLPYPENLLTWFTSIV